MEITTTVKSLRYAETMLLMLFVLINSANKAPATSQDISLCQTNRLNKFKILGQAIP